MNICSNFSRKLFILSNLLSNPRSALPCSPVIQIARNYREIQAFEDGNVTTIKGVGHSDDKTNIARRLDPDDHCPIRSRGLQITPEDVLILRQFISSTGEVLRRDETGLCQHEYFKVIACVKMAQRSNMLPGPENTTASEDGTTLNRFLTRYPIGTRSPIKGRGLWYRRNYFRVGDARLLRDAPVVGRRRVIQLH